MTEPAQSTKEYGRDFLVAAFVVFMAFIPYVAQLSRPRNRYLLQFEPAETVFVVGFSLVGGLVLLAATCLVRRCGGPGRLAVRFSVGFIPVFLGMALISWAVHFLVVSRGWLPREAHLVSVYLVPVCALIAGLLCAGAGRAASWGRRTVRTLCLILSPLILIGPLMVLVGRSHEAPRDPPEFSGDPERDEADRPLFLFVFDMWDYDLSFREGVLNENFQDLRPYVDDFLVFHAAKSPFPKTLQSVPRILFQRDDEFRIRRDNSLVFEVDGVDVPVSELPTIFSLARGEKVPSYALGYYHNYEELVGHEADLTMSFPVYGFQGGGFSSRVSNVLITAFDTSWLRSSLEPLLGDPLRFDDSLRVEHVRKLDLVLDGVREIIFRGADGAIAYVHLLLPHPPFIWDRSGVREGTEVKVSDTYADLVTDGDGPSEYALNLQYLDRIIGRILGWLEESGRYDRSTIVFTSDHGALPSETMERSDHIPLLIKLPFSSRTGDVGTEIVNSHLVEWLRREWAKGGR